MKKLLTLALALMILFIANFSFAESDGFEYRNGITFGMTKSAVKSHENLKLSRDVNRFLSYSGSVAGFSGSIIEYHFQDGKLYYIYVLLGDKTDTTLNKVREDYANINTGLVEKYGKPLGNRNGTTSNYTTEALDYLWTSKAIASFGGASFDYQYDEWLLPVDGGNVKIDHYWYSTYGKNQKTNKYERNTRHIIGYRFFSTSNSYGNDL